MYSVSLLQNAVWDTELGLISIHIFFVYLILYIATSISKHFLTNTVSETYIGNIHHSE